MFGSDWPVCLLAANYEEVLSTAQTLVTRSLGESAEDGVFGGNAARFYRLEDRATSLISQDARPLASGE